MAHQPLRGDSLVEKKKKKQEEEEENLKRRRRTRRRTRTTLYPRSYAIASSAANNNVAWYLYRVFQKNGPLDYFDDNFSKYGLILTIFSLLQQENYGAQNLSYFSHLTFIMLPLYLEKQTLMQVSMSLLRHYCVCV